MCVCMYVCMGSLWQGMWVALGLRTAPHLGALPCAEALLLRPTCAQE